jgi:hypothetical protein
VNQIKEQDLASAKAIVDNIKTYQNKIVWHSMITD